MSGLHEAFDEIVADVPVYGDLDRAIEQADQERRRRLAVVASLSAAAAVVAVIVGALVITRDGTDSQQPIGPSTPTDTTTETTGPANHMTNGRIQGIEEYLTRVPPACGDCILEGTAFDQDTRTLLVGLQDERGNVLGLSVFGPDGLIADLACPDDFACVPETVGQLDPWTLGPDADEFSVRGADDDGSAEVHVVGFDGTVRRTIDLSAVVDDFSTVRDLAWSPDGSRLAVTTREFVRQGDVVTGEVYHLWLMGREGGEPQRVYTASYAGPVSQGDDPAADVWDVAWSPDGSRLGFIEAHGGIQPPFLLIQAVSLLLPEPGQDGPGTARTLYEYEPPPSANDDLGAFGWSPDGTRVAVRVPGTVLELSAEDGSVLAEHPFIDGFLIWPARQS